MDSPIEFAASSFYLSCSDGLMTTPFPYPDKNLPEILGHIFASVVDLRWCHGQAGVLCWLASTGARQMQCHLAHGVTGPRGEPNMRSTSSLTSRLNISSFGVQAVIPVLPSPAGFLGQMWITYSGMYDLVVPPSHHIVCARVLSESS